MDAVSYSLASKQAQRIEKFIENPDSSSGIVTVPKVIGAGENVTVPAGRVAVLPNVQVDGTLNVEGEVFIPAGTTLSKVVELEGDQIIADIKTFLDSPIVPTPTTGTQAVNKDYADLKVALAQFTGTNQSLSQNGYQKLPGGLIIQWGFAPFTTQGVSATKAFPVSFPNYCLSVNLTDYAALSSFSVIWAINDYNRNNFSYHFSLGSSGAGASLNRIPFYITIGY